MAAQAGDARVPGAPGHDTAQQGDDPGEQVRHAGQVAEDEIAVEADERQQLLQHLQVRNRDDQQQDLGRGGRVEAGQGQHEDQVEVQATEVGPQPACPAEPVGVGDVGEERRPDQVDPDADHAGPRTSVAAAGRVSALVESGGDHGQTEHDEQIHRVAQDLLDAAAQPVDGEQPVVHGQDAADHGHDEGSVEERPQECSGGVRRALGQERAPRPEREQRIGRGRRRRGGLVGDDAERQQFGRDEVADLLGAQGPAEILADQLRDGDRVAGAVDPADHPVQQRGHLDDLAVGPPDERRWLAVAGVLVLAEQFDPLGQPGRFCCLRRAVRGRGGWRGLGGHVSCGHGHGSAPPTVRTRERSGVTGARSLRAPEERKGRAAREWPGGPSPPPRNPAMRSRLVRGANRAC